MKSVIVNSNEAGQRLDKLLGKYLNLAGQGFLYKMMRKKNITLNGKKCDGSEKLSEGDEIRLFLSDETIDKFSHVRVQKVRKTKLDLVYEDSHILLINKPSGMLSQKAKDTDESLVEYVIAYLMETGQLTVSSFAASIPLSATGWIAIPAVLWQQANPWQAFRCFLPCFRIEAFIRIICVQ